MIVPYNIQYNPSPTKEKYAISIKLKNRFYLMKINTMLNAFART